MLGSYPDPAAQGTSVTATGTKFEGLSEASGGGFNNSATNYPLLMLHRIDNEETLFLPLDAASGFTSTSRHASRVLWPWRNLAASTELWRRFSPKPARIRPWRTESFAWVRPVTAEEFGDRHAAFARWLKFQEFYLRLVACAN